jgi:hypothetical protein
VGDLEAAEIAIVIESVVNLDLTEWEVLQKPVLAETENSTTREAAVTCLAPRVLLMEAEAVAAVDPQAALH